MYYFQNQHITLQNKSEKEQSLVNTMPPGYKKKKKDRPMPKKMTFLVFLDVGQPMQQKTITKKEFYHRYLLHQKFKKVAMNAKHGK